MVFSTKSGIKHHKTKPNLRIGCKFENLQKGHQSADVCDVEIKHGLEAGRRSESYIYMVVHKIFQQYT